MLPNLNLMTQERVGYGSISRLKLLAISPKIFARQVVSQEAQFYASSNLQSTKKAQQKS
jgi:hypothetical protein